MAKKPDTHYVDNELFYQLLLERQLKSQSKETIDKCIAASDILKELYAEKFKEEKRISKEYLEKYCSKIDPDSLLTYESIIALSDKIDDQKYIMKELVATEDYPKPQVSNQLGKILIDIGTNQCYRSTFITYSQFHQDMIGDNIENCLRYLDNFNPYLYKNPFAYFTQICYYASIRRIMKEKKQTNIKQKYYDSRGIEIENVSQFVESYEEA